MIYGANKEISGFALASNFTRVGYSYMKRQEQVNDEVYVIKDAMAILSANKMLAEGMPHRFNRLNCKHLAHLDFMGLRLESALCDGEKVRLLTLGQIGSKDLEQCTEIADNTFATMSAEQIMNKVDKMNKVHPRKHNDAGLFIKGAYGSGRVIKIIASPVDLFKADYQQSRL